MGRIQRAVRNASGKHREVNQESKENMTYKLPTGQTVIVGDYAGFASAEYEFSPSEIAINAALDKIVAAFEKYVVNPLLGTGPVGAAGED